MSKGSNTTTSSNTPTALPAYQNAISQLQNVAATPYTPYGGELIAPVNQQQYAGIGGINQFATAAQPYLQTAAGYAQSAAQPLTQGQIQQYESPYTQDVVNATEAQFNNQNAQQQQQILGNAAAQGALGGDRTAVAQAVLAGQQQAQEAPVIAGLENQGYLTGLQTAQQQQQNLAQGAYNLGNVANSIQNAGLMGANAQVGAGTLEQQTQQAADQAAYQQFMQQQFMPESMLSWELPLLTGVGSQEGGTSTTTGPAPNPLGQYLGLGIAGLGAAGQAGGSAGIAGLLPLLGLSDRRAKENIRKIGKLNNGRDVYRFNYKGDPTTHIGLMAQDVEKDNPDAVHEVGGLKHVDYDEATKDAVRRFLGGRIQGLQSGGVPSGLGFSPGGNPWLTDAPMPLGPGAPPPPKLPGQVVQTPAQMAQNATGLANAMKKAFPTPQNSGDDVTTVGINSATGQFQSGPGINTGFMEYDNGVPTGILGVGPTDAGLTYGPGYRDGGLTLPRHNRIDLKRSMPVRAGLGMASFMPRRGFDDGGAADLSPNDYIAQNFPATLPGPRGVPFDASDPDAGIFSPVAPGRDPKYSLANLTDTGLVPTDLPPEITAGTSVPPQQTGLGAAAYMPEDVGSREAPLPAPPDSVNAAPAQTEKQKGLFGLSPDFYTSLMAAGLGMMASRSPFLGTAIGEGGLQGINTYTGLKKQEQDVDLKVRQLNQAAKAEQDRIALESRKYNEMTASEKAAADFRERNLQREMMQPVKMGTDTMGREIYGIRDPATGTLKPIEIPPFMGSGLNPLKQPSAGTAQPQSGMTPATYTAVADTLPVGLEPPVTAGRDEDFFGNLQATDPRTAATVKGLADYEINPNSLSIKGGHREQLLGLTRQYDSSYDQTLYPAKQRAVTEFFAGGPSSPAGTLTAGNTAILHLGELDGMIDRLRGQPGMLNSMFDAVGGSGIPLVSYWANAARNQAVQGTPQGAALQDFLTARARFTDEVTKFYAGSQGSEAERQRAIDLLDAAKSPEELHAAVKTDVGLMRDKIAQLQGRLMGAMGPQAWKAAVKQDPNLVITYKNSRDTIDRVMNQDASRRLGAPQAPIGGNTNAERGAAPPAANAPALPAGIPAGSVHGTSRTQGPGWKTPDGRFIPDKS